MLVVVASRHDQAAKALVESWAGHGASLLTSEDLSVAGWRHHLSSSEVELSSLVATGAGNQSRQLKNTLDLDSTAVVGGQAIAIEQITGVLTRLPCIFESELLHIVPEDRGYVAAEMNAFLISWLSQLQYPVLNRPTPTYLLGPAWRPEQWSYAAAQLGIPVRPRQRKVVLSPQLASTQITDKLGVRVTVVGQQCLGTANQTLMRYARNLADAAKVDMLTVYFGGDESQVEFLSADLWTDISSPEVADAILEYLCGGNAQC